MVKPGGTGSPARVISATPAPLPPSRSRIDALPSSKRYTHFCARRLGPAPLDEPPRRVAATVERFVDFGARRPDVADDLVARPVRVPVGMGNLVDSCTTLAGCERGTSATTPRAAPAGA